MMRSRLARAAVALALVAGIPTLSVTDPPGASATHYRANQLNWHVHSGTTVGFHVTGSWRMSFYLYRAPDGSSRSTAQVGDTFSPTCITFDEATWASDCPEFTVTAVDPANDVVSGETHATHDYGAVGRYTAALDDCCRLSGPLHRNNPDGSVRLQTHVDLARTTANPVSSAAPIVDCPRESLCRFTVPAFDPDGQALRWRLSSSEEAGGPWDGFAQPAGAAIDPGTGLYTWDTTGASLNGSGDSFFSTQVMVENLVGGDVVTETPVDFFIRVGDATNQQPVFEDPTPADGTEMVSQPGAQVSFGVRATDPDAADTVTPGAIGLPAGASLAVTPGNPGTATFTWVPTAAQVGDHLVILTAADQHGLGATARALRMRVLVPTALTAFPVVARVVPQVGTPSVQVMGNGVSYQTNLSGVYLTVAARLTTAAGAPTPNAPIGNRLLRFLTRSGTPFCESPTYPDGYATCTNLVDHTLAAAISTGYQVSYGGDQAFGSSHAVGGLVSGP